MLKVLYRCAALLCFILQTYLKNVQGEVCLLDERKTSSKICIKYTLTRLVR